MLYRNVLALCPFSSAGLDIFLIILEESKFRILEKKVVNFVDINNAVRYVAKLLNDALYGLYFFPFCFQAVVDYVVAVENHCLILRIP
jgi:hypothetical protein